MAKEYKQGDSQNLPACAVEFIKLVIKKMRYRRKILLDVQAELEAHFEDGLKDCVTGEQREKKARDLISEFGDVKLLAVLLRRAKKRCRPLWRTVVARTFQTVGVLFLCFILYAIWFSCGEPTISVDYMALLNQMNQPEVRDEDNAWPYYEKAINLYIQPGQTILRLTGRPRRDFKKSLNFHDLNEGKQNNILQWLEQNESHWDNLDPSQKQLIGKCLQAGLVPLPFPKYAYRRYYMGFDEAIEDIVWRIVSQPRSERRESLSEYEYEYDMMMEMERQARPKRRRGEIALVPDAALDAEIIAWFDPYSQKELENVERAIEVGAIKQWLNNPPVAAKCLFDCLLPFERKLIVKWTAENEAAWQEFAAGSSRSYCYREYQCANEQEGRWTANINLAHFNRLKRLARLGLWRARVNIKEGQTQQALADCVAVCRAGSHWQGKGTITDQLVGLAISSIGHEEILHIVQWQNLLDVDLEQFQQQLSQIYPGGYPLMNIEGERLEFLATIQRVFTEGGLGGGHLIPGRWDQLSDDMRYLEERERKMFMPFSAAVSMVHARRDETVAKVNQIYDHLSRIVKTTPFERHRSGQKTAYEMFLSMPRYRFFLIDIYMPAGDHASALVFRGKASHEATLTILALKRCRLEKDEYPARLDELVSAGFLKDLPMDPYSDKPLIYKKADNNFTIYSVGPNFTDDGGEPGKDTRGRIKKWVDNGDMVFWPVPQS